MAKSILDRFLTWTCRNTATVSFFFMGSKGHAIHSPNAHSHIIYRPVPPHSCVSMGTTTVIWSFFCLWGWRTLTIPKMLEGCSHSRGSVYYDTVLHDTMAGVTYKDSSMHSQSPCLQEMWLDAFPAVMIVVTQVHLRGGVWSYRALWPVVFITHGRHWR